MNLPANRRLIGVIAIIASSVVAASVPFLYHAQPGANSVSNGNGSGNNGNTNPNTNPSPTQPTPSTSNNNGKSDNQHHNNGHHQGHKGHKVDPGSVSTENHGRGHGHAYGHVKQGDPKQAGSNGRRLGASHAAHGNSSEAHTAHGKHS